MRKAKRAHGFWLCFLFNIFLNFEGVLPAVILLILHFLLEISLWWSVLAAALWVIGILLYMSVIDWANQCGNTPDKPKENKNPYSAKNQGQNAPSGEAVNEKS